MTTYYVDATDGDDEAAGTSTDTAWQTLAKVNAATFAAGDSILLKRGEIWRETLSPPSSGENDNPITFGAYSTGSAPMILGSDVLSSWTSEVVGGFTAYYATQATNPIRAFADGASLVAAASKAALTAGSFWWDDPNNRLYVRLAADADPSGHVVAAGARDQALYASDKSHLTFSDLTFAETKRDATEITGTFAGITFTGCTAARTAGYGFYLCPPWEGSDAGTGVLIEGCTAYDNCATGIFIAGNVNGARVANCETYNNGIIITGARSVSFEAGIRCVGDRDGACSNLIFEDNHSHDNGAEIGEADWSAGSGLYFDTPGSGCVMRRNRSTGNHRSGLWVENSGAADPAPQLVCNIVTGAGHGIELYRNVHNVLVAHNVVYDSAQDGILVLGNGAAADVTGNRVHNNIVFGQPWVCLRAYEGGDNDGAKGWGNLYDHNCFGPGQAYMVVWGGYSGPYYATYAAWEAVAGQQHSVEADPLFVDAGSNDFRLQVGSPCIMAGKSLLDVVPDDFVTRPFVITPDVGAYSHSYMEATTLTSGIQEGGLDYAGRDRSGWTKDSVQRIRTRTSRG